MRATDGTALTQGVVYAVGLSCIRPIAFGLGIPCGERRALVLSERPVPVRAGVCGRVTCFALLACGRLRSALVCALRCAVIVTCGIAVFRRQRPPTAVGKGGTLPRAPHAAVLCATSGRALCRIGGLI